MLDLDKLCETLQVETNIMNEKIHEKAKHEQASRAMEEARNR